MEMPALRQQVWIVVPGPSEARFPSRVEEVLGPMIHLAMPGGEDARAVLRPDVEAKLQFFDADGHVVLQGSIVDQAGGLLRFCPSESQGQRRQFLRWEADLPVQLRYVDEEGWFRARLVDVGGGGIAVRVGKPMDADRDVAIQLRLPTGPVTAEGRVVTQRADGSSTRVGLRFVRITDAARSRIVRFVFQEELRWRHGNQGVDPA